MEQILVQRAEASPTATAIIDNEKHMSYRELIARADMLVQQLHEKGLKPNDTVCIFLESGRSQVVAQVAVLRAGGTSVPVEPSIPLLRLNSMLSDIGTQYIITSQDLSPSMSEYITIAIDNVMALETPLQKTDEIPVRASCTESHQSHIFFTSGSTGQPKPIQVPARGILHVFQSFPITPLGPQDRMTLFINPGFDFSLFEIWVTLLSGATIVQIPKMILTDPGNLGAFLDQMQITAMIIPTALFNVIALVTPSTFRGRRHVLVGGEAVNAAAMRKVWESGPPENLWNAYGPAEATIYVTLGRVNAEEVRRDRISIGQPLGQTKVYLLDEQQKPITEPNKRGEICVSGPQVSAGYLNRPAETEKHFIHLDLSQHGEEGLCRVYRTGDMGQWTDGSRSLDYIGRVDQQIKRSGHRVELGDIEHTLEMNHLVHSCVAIQHHRATSDLLVGYFIPASSELKHELQEIIDWARQRLPPYMVPDMLIKVQEFPMSANGKVNRGLLGPDMQGDTTEKSMCNDEKHMKHIEPDRWLQSMLQELLCVCHVGPQDNILQLGLTSLQAAKLIAQIMQCKGKKVTMAQVHENPTLQGLSTILQTPDEASSDPDRLQRWEQDARLADPLFSALDWQSDEKGHIFLTGATGFVGAYLLDRLLSMPTVRKVACLVRSRGNLSASRRVQETLEKYDLWDGSLEKMQKIIVLDGELSDDTLGLGEDQFQWLADWTSVIFHLGARVNWCEPYEAHLGANVIGTRNIIRLAGQGRRKALHYLSSIDAWNVTGYVHNTARVFEDESLQPYLGSLLYDMGYAQSQWVADEMIQRARAQGIPVAIYRPGFVIGDHERALGNPDDFFARFIVGCIQSGCFPDLPHQRLEYVTVDYICSAMLHIASNNDNLGHAFHLVSPDPAQSVSINGTFDLLRQAGYHMKLIPYPAWVDKINQYQGDPLEPMLPLLQEKVTNGLTRMQTSTNTPIYETGNTRWALANRPDIQYTPLDHGLLRRFVENWVSKGFYKY